MAKQGNPNPDIYKWCTLGQHWEYRWLFNKNRTRADGLSNTCRDCDNTRTRRYHSEVRREQRTNMSLQEYTSLVDRQGGACAVCKNIPQEALCADHDHATGQPRRLLCHRCNLILGLVDDDPDYVSHLENYIREFRSLAAPLIKTQPNPTRKENQIHVPRN